MSYVAEDFIGKVYVHKHIAGQEFVPRTPVLKPAGFVGDYTGCFGGSKKFVELKELLADWQEYKP